MENYTGGTIELLLSGDIQTGATTDIIDPLEKILQLFWKRYLGSLAQPKRISRVAP